MDRLRKKEVIVREPRLLLDLSPFIQTILDDNDSENCYNIFKKAAKGVLKVRPDGLFLGTETSEITPSMIWFVGLVNIWLLMTEGSTS